jgi:hypothetical protein
MVPVGALRERSDLGAAARQQLAHQVTRYFFVNHIARLGDRLVGLPK